MKRVRETSKRAYYTIENEGLLTKVRLHVYQTLFHYGPLTQMETCRTIDDKNRQDRTFMPRFAELRNMGVIVEIGEKICSITGRNVILWDVTKKLPTALLKKKSKD